MHSEAVPETDAPRPVSAAEIDRLVASFYADIRRDPMLSPVFFEAIGHDPVAWRVHEARIAGFWRNALQIERGAYDGNPMRVHRTLPGIRPQHFERWLELFAIAAGRVLEPAQAQAIHALATRIGQGLKMAVVHSGGDPDAPPILR